MREIQIAGGGLAGLSLGIALRHHEVPVTVHEAGTYPRHRVCGEFINGVRPATLEALQLTKILSSALRHTRTRWFLGGKPIFSATLFRPALGISRWELDDLLREFFLERGGTLLTRQRLKPEPAPGLVWTAGRVLAKDGPWLGLKAHFSNLSLPHGLEMHLGSGGYVGLAALNSEATEGNVCGLFRPIPGLKTRAPELLSTYVRQCGLSQLADRLDAAEIDPVSVTGLSGFHLGSQPAVPGLCALGDAERIIPPFTGNGMSMAFESAETALPHLIAYARGEIEWDFCREKIAGGLRRRFALRMGLALGLHRFLFTGPGRSTFATLARTKLLPFQTLHRALS